MKTTQNMENKNNIIGWAVCYVPTREGKLFANLKCETMQCFESQDDAIKYCNNINCGGYIDELHIGYRVYPMQWIPKNMKLQPSLGA
jgi:hypothetical protein